MISCICTVVNTSSGKQPTVSIIRKNGESRKKYNLYCFCNILHTCSKSVTQSLRACKSYRQNINGLVNHKSFISQTINSQVPRLKYKLYKARILLQRVFLCVWFCGFLYFFKVIFYLSLFFLFFF